jgi:hypothetical protein
MAAVRAREAELFEAWRRREEEVKKELDERVQCVISREEQIKVEVGKCEGRVTE